MPCQAGATPDYRRCGDQDEPRGIDRHVLDRGNNAKPATGITIIASVIKPMRNIARKFFNRISSCRGSVRKVL